jgi:hypothetical protein
VLRRAVRAPVNSEVGSGRCCQPILATARKCRKSDLRPGSDGMRSNRRPWRRSRWLIGAYHHQHQAHVAARRFAGARLGAVLTLISSPRRSSPRVSSKYPAAAPPRVVRSRRRCSCIIPYAMVRFQFAAALAERPHRLFCNPPARFDGRPSRARTAKELRYNQRPRQFRRPADRAPVPAAPRLRPAGYARRATP